MSTKFFRIAKLSVIVAVCILVSACGTKSQDFKSMVATEVATNRGLAESAQATADSNTQANSELDS